MYFLCFMYFLSVPINTYLSELREQFLENVWGNVDNFDTLENGEKLKSLMIDYPRQTAKYINRAMDIRRKLVYLINNK